MSKTITAGRSPKIFIERVDGDLSLVGWESEEILIKADEEELRVSQNGDEVKISCGDDASIRVPKAASVFIQNIGGDAAIRGILGGIELREAGGDLSIRDVDNVAIDTIHADLSLRGAKGHLSVGHAHADVSIRDVDGNVSLESIADDLALRDVRGNVNANVGEDVVLYLNPQPGNAYSITAGEDILLVMPPKTNATLTLNADEIDIEWKDIANEEDATSRVVTLGNGAAMINLNAGGDIRVSNQSDAGESAEDFGNFAGIGVDWSGFGERISRQVEQATRRASQKAEDAVKRAERSVERAERRGAFLKVGRWNWDVTPRGVPTPPKPPVSEEERLEILKMLQEKKITAEEADKLLSALEGDA
jgi:hypothetical protein